jgi:hypothetical protein
LNPTVLEAPVGLLIVGSLDWAVAGSSHSLFRPAFCVFFQII